VDFITKDSGDREEFDTGSRRDTREGKGRYDLLPSGAIKRIAQLYERGAEKYGDRNWELGQPRDRFIDSMLRHGFAVSNGDVDEDHIAAVAWNAMAIIELDERLSKNDPADAKLRNVYYGEDRDSST
jgi:Domain of unknown function (DUF5664)